MKKIVCMILCVLLLAGAFPVCVFAQSDDHVPIIQMYGFMSCPVFSENGTKLFPMEKNAILGFVKKLLPSLSSFAVNKNWTKFGDRLIPALNDLLMPIACDGQGVPKNGTNVQFTYPSPEEVAKSESVRFLYDWRDDPYVSAAQLNDFIRYLTDTCGCARVAIDAHSYAGIVMLTYLSEYGTDKVQSVCFNATAVYGAAFAGELMQGKMQLDTDALVAFLEGLFDQMEYEALLRAVVSLLDDLGGVRFLVNFLNQLFVHLNDRIWTESLLPALDNWPSIWAMVPDSDLEAAYAFRRAHLRTDNAEDEQIFLEKTQRYNREIRQNRESLLRGIDEKCNLYVIARYGYSGIPLSKIWKAVSDGVLNTEAESFGATCTPYTLSHPLEHPGKLIAPSGMIDASTCLFPTQTWFVRNCKHAQKDPPMEKFAASLLLSPTQLTIDSLEDYPQFLYYDKVFHDLYIDINQTVSIAKWYQDLWRLIKQVFANWWQKIVQFFTPKRKTQEAAEWSRLITEDYPTHTILVQ